MAGTCVACTVGFASNQYISNFIGIILAGKIDSGLLLNLESVE